jgi:hypothetical protein
MHKNTEKPVENRREFARVIPDQAAPVRININGVDFIEVTNAVDVSEGGIRISVKHRFAGCHVDLPASFIVHLPAPINKHFSFKGRIKHVLDDSYGVQFAGLDKADHALVRRYIESRSDKPISMGYFQDYFRNLFRLTR